MAAASMPAASVQRTPNRWIILFFSVLSMVAVANFQYGWTLFVDPLRKQLNVDRALIQVTFTIFVLLETWLVPFEGKLVDTLGPKLVVIAGGLMAGVGWVGAGYSQSLTDLYLWYAVAGIGAGAVYGTAIGSALKWFPDHRGFTAGLTAAGFGAGSALTVVPIANMINSAGYQAAFIKWGIIQGVVVVIAALFLKAPPANWSPAGWTPEKAKAVTSRQTTSHFTAAEMASTPHFWLMYVMMAMVATGGLMAIAQLAPMATDFKVAKINVSLFWLTMPALTFALSIDRVLNGICRPFWGWVSDHIGRERTMTCAFGLEAIAIFTLLHFASHPMLFVIMSAFTFFGWGEIFSLFPATCGDFFGRKHATENYGFLYTAKGTASMFVPIGSALAAGKAFDFRADIMLILGALLAMFTMFLGPTVLKLNFSKAVRSTLLVVALLFALYGIVLTVLPSTATAHWTPFQAKWMLPKWGWVGVFRVAIAFDILAAFCAFFILRKMKAPVKKEQGVPAKAAGAHAGA